MLPPDPSHTYSVTKKLGSVNRKLCLNKRQKRTPRPFRVWGFPALVNHKTGFVFFGFAFGFQPDNNPPLGVKESKV
jgi:hypothetical protein